MDWIISVAIIVLAAMIHATLQLGLGSLLLLYHASMGKHVKTKTRELVGSYIAGIGILVFLSICATCFVLLRFYDGALSTGWLIILVGVLTALALAVWLFYYRWGKGTTELWIPKVIARFIDNRAKVTESNTEAFSLGVLTCFAEMPFSLVLLVIAGNSILELQSESQLLLVAIYTIIVILPMLIMRQAIKNGKTVVDIQRWRVKNKKFLKRVSGAGFAVLALFILVFKIIIEV